MQLANNKRHIFGDILGCCVNFLMWVSENLESSCFLLIFESPRALRSVGSHAICKWLCNRNTLVNFGCFFQNSCQQWPPRVHFGNHCLGNVFPRRNLHENKFAKVTVSVETTNYDRFPSVLDSPPRLHAL